jgi:hypothetical protein
MKCSINVYIAILSSYEEIFSSILPVKSLLPLYSLENENKCSKCTNLKKCSATYIQETKDSIRSLLNWRDYDELHILRNTLNKIIEKQQSYGNEISISELKRSLEDKQRSITHNIRNKFPKAKRWANTVTILSAPAAIISATTGNIPATIVSASLTALALASQKFMEIYESRGKWIGYFEKDTIKVE